jgi:hypothetical protein
MSPANHTTDEPGQHLFACRAKFSFQDVEALLRKLGAEHPRKLDLDFSKLERATDSATVGLLIVCDHVHRSGGLVRFFPPVPSALAAEERFLRRIEKTDSVRDLEIVRKKVKGAAHRRTAAIRHLEKMGFLSHFDETIHDWLIYKSTAFGPGAWPFKLADDDDSRILTSYVPLRFLEPDGEIQHAESADEMYKPGRWVDDLTVLLGQARRYISSSAADTLARAAYVELVSNVYEHAGWESPFFGGPKALVGAAIEPDGPSEAGEAIGGRVEQLASYVAWLRSERLPAIHIWVADSGATIPATIGSAYDSLRQKSPRRPVQTTRTAREEQDLLLFALSPLGSRHVSENAKRGTRGLARLARVVRENQGAIVVRSGRGLAGYSYPERQRHEIRQSHLPYFPGTVVQLIMPALRRSLRHRALIRQPVPPSPPKTFVVTSNIASGANLDQLEEQISKAQARVQNVFIDTRDVCVILDTSPNYELRQGRLHLEALAARVGKLAVRFESTYLFAILMPHLTFEEVSSPFGTLDDARERHGGAELVGAEIPEEVGTFLTIAGDGGWAFHGGVSRSRRALYAAAAGDTDEYEIRQIVQANQPGWNWFRKISTGFTLSVQPIQVIQDTAAHALAQISEQASAP